MQALNEVKDAPGSKNGKAVPGDDYYFELIVVRGRMKLEVTGDPRSSADIDALLEVLGTFGTEA